MAIILEFRRSEEEAARITKPLEGLLGEIIIFPGVRVERRSARKRPKQTITPLRRRAQRSRKKQS